MSVQQYQSPIGVLAISHEGTTVLSLDLFAAKFGHHIGVKSKDKSSVAIESALDQYFKDCKSTLSLGLNPEGTPFQIKVWQALKKIPPGKTKTYGELANELHSSARAVGNACRRNPIPIFIPCHRVVAKNGIGGFSGKTQGNEISVKQWLLAHEGITF